jgi:hypothetical protein
VATHAVVPPAFSVEGVQAMPVLVARWVTLRVAGVTALVGLDDGLKFDPPLKLGVIV